MKWQPIETAPKDGTAILTEYGVMAVYNISKKTGWALCHIDGDLHEENFGDLSIYDPTHWMPLPEPPKD